VGKAFSWQIEASGGPVGNVETDTTRRPFEISNRCASFDFEYCTYASPNWVGDGLTVELKIGKTLVAVDKGIAEAVKRLNELGFITVSSCSGLREDHCSMHPLEATTFITVAGRSLELIEIAEASEWNWFLEGKAVYSKEGEPISYVNFFSIQGCVYKLTASARGIRQIPSSMEEAIGSPLPFYFTELELDTEEPIKDEFIKRKIAVLLEAIVRYAREKLI
jgi:hypothetical protein